MRPDLTHLGLETLGLDVLARLAPNHFGGDLHRILGSVIQVETVSRGSRLDQNGMRGDCENMFLRSSLEGLAQLLEHSREPVWT